MRKREVHVGLELYSPQTQLGALRKLAVESRLVNIPRHPILYTRLAREAAKEKPIFFTERRGKRHIEKANREVYRELAKRLNLKGNKVEAGKAAWFKHADIANDVISELVDKVAKPERQSFELANEVALIQEPGEIIQLILSPDSDTDRRVKHELARQVGIALVSMQIEARTEKVRSRVKEIQRWLDIDIFDGNHKIGEGKQYDVKTLNDANTNEAYKVQLTDRETGQEILTKSSDNIPDEGETISHKFPVRMRTVDDIGLVFTSPRVKDEREAAKKAVVRTLSNGNGKTEINPTEIVRDQGGLMFVVADEFYSNGEKVSLLMDKFKTVIEQRFGKHKPTFNERNTQNGNNPYTSDGNKNTWRRLEVRFADLENPIEVIFTGIGDQLNRDNRIGNVDQETGTPDGEAHSLYEARRNMKMFELCFPQEDPTWYGGYDAAALKKRLYDHEIQELRNSRVDTSETRLTN